MTPRDIEKEKENILNGNRYVVNTNEGKGVFLRDVDKLIHQYKNLRTSIFRDYKDYLPDPISQEELKSYIDEQFVRLVKEYDINGPVDFPGYIKTKLTQRVKNSYIRGEHRDRKRVFVPRNDFDISNLIESSPSHDEELDYYEALEYVLHDVELNEIEKETLFLILQEFPDTQIEKKLRQSYGNIASNAQIKDTVKNMQYFLKTKLNEGLRR
ncbi:RNA polymerase sigma factor [Bacillus phage Shbh1]|uniref:RNA polymerase sigma factor-like protein n=1 Tax=Bacillus phage Shbh1 TaxID=1796992 RepID=A0A142F1J0_9CAUD|nr:RNA polymerase sigma factor [Bacillus phage Shbh1]AMQ66647.1 RNA polymerase sigma factor-like protein [Bacillus phage Shbh1]